MRAKSTSIGFFADSSASSATSAMRGHASFRLALGPQRQHAFTGAVVTTFSLGPGRYEWASSSSYWGPDCIEYDRCVSAQHGEGRSLSFGVQVGLFARLRVLALGIALRFDTTDDYGVLGLSPQLGLAF